MIIMNILVITCNPWAIFHTRGAPRRPSVVIDGSYHWPHHRHMHVISKEILGAPVGAP